MENTIEYGSTQPFGKRMEKRFCDLHGFVKHGGVRDTDCMHPQSGAIVEVKSIMSEVPAVVAREDGFHPKYAYCDFVRKASNNKNANLPALRMAHAFRAAFESPGSYTVIICPPKLNRNVPERIYYYRSIELAECLADAICAGELELEGPECTSQKFAICFKFELETVQHIELTREEFMEEVMGHVPPTEEEREDMSAEAWVTWFRTVYVALDLLDTCKLYTGKLPFLLAFDEDYNELFLDVLHDVRSNRAL